MNKMITVALCLFANVAMAAAPTQIQGYGGNTWIGTCTNLTTAGSQASAIKFDVTAYPTVKLEINGSNFSVVVGTRGQVTLPSGVSIGVLLDLSSTNDFVFHTYNDTTVGTQEQQMSFSLASPKQLSMRQDSWTYSGGTTAAGDSYFCKYAR